MAVERGGEKGWGVERCYMLREDYDRVMALPERGRDLSPEVPVLAGRDRKPQLLCAGYRGFLRIL